MNESGEDESEADADPEMKDEHPENEDGDAEMAPQTLTESQIQDIQSKLLNKVLPVLEKHLVEGSDKHTVIGFVSFCYAKTIRKLPPAKFNIKL